jgi:ligand-binding SRPBCC domain-containing protein
MPCINLQIEIDAPVDICFNLARSIDLHLYCLQHTGEKAIGGVINGLIGPEQEVTWHAYHFGIPFLLTSKITIFNFPNHFRDSMVKGPFKRFDHDHYFEFIDGKTFMRERFDYESPFGFLGKMADSLFLKEYMTNLLAEKNKKFKQVAERTPFTFLQ